MTKKENKYYKKTNWKGHDNFECTQCDFSTLSRPLITQHVEQHLAGERSVKAATEQRELDRLEAEKHLGISIPEDPPAEPGKDPANKKKKKK